MEEGLAEKVEIARGLYLERKANDERDYWGLNQERGELELEINFLLLNGGILENEVLDYCFRNFVQSFEDTSFERVYYRTSTFDSVGAVLRFIDDVKKRIGRPFTMTRRDNVINRGIINGCTIGRVENRSDLYLRDEISGRLFYVPPDVLKFLNIPVNWETMSVSSDNWSGERIYLGGRVYNEFGVYLGES